MKRSLLLAGGGVKVAFQAGVMQVLLTEAKLEFDHYDACSGGAFNLVLLCDGRTGIEIADEWRDLHPQEGVSVRWQDVVAFPFGRSLLTLDNYRRKVFRRWGLDWDTINASELDATFTVHDRTRGERREFGPAQMTEDLLVACLSQAVWFPPVEVDGTLYTDAVFDTDANVDAALARHVDEIWVIWTVSRRPEWMPGLMAQFFHALEVSANGTLQKDLQRARAQGVCVREIVAEVPVHYLLLASADRLHRAVELGVRTARRWCDENGYGFKPIDRSSYYDDGVVLTFTDHLTGRLRGRATEADLHLTVDDSGEFASSGRQRVRLSGTVTSSLTDGEAEVVDGWAEIFVNAMDGKIEEDPTRKRMQYVAHLRTPSGRLLTLFGTKTVETPNLRRAIRESMTLKCRLMEGHVEPDDVATEIAHGFLWMTWRDVASQFVRADAPGSGLVTKYKGLGRYAAFFAGSLWDVAMRRWLTYAPF